MKRSKSKSDTRLCLGPGSGRTGLFLAMSLGVLVKSITHDVGWSVRAKDVKLWIPSGNTSAHLSCKVSINPRSPSDITLITFIRLCTSLRGQTPSDHSERSGPPVQYFNHPCIAHGAYNKSNIQLHGNRHPKSNRNQSLSVRDGHVCGVIHKHVIQDFVSCAYETGRKSLSEGQGTVDHSFPREVSFYVSIIDYYPTKPRYN